MPRHGFLLMRTNEMAPSKQCTCLCVRTVYTPSNVHTTAWRSECVYPHAFRMLFCWLKWSDRKAKHKTKQKIKMEKGIFAEFCKFHFVCSLQLPFVFLLWWYAYFSSHFIGYFPIKMMIFIEFTELTETGSKNLYFSFGITLLFCHLFSICISPLLFRRYSTLILMLVKKLNKKV